MASPQLSFAAAMLLPLAALASAAAPPKPAAVMGAGLHADAHERGVAAQPARPDRAALRSRAALDAWLGRHRSEVTPLDALSPGARERFLDGLAFGDGGIGGLDTADLSSELTQAQIDAMLRWLSLTPGAVTARRSAGSPVILNPSITPIERRVTDYLRLISVRHAGEQPAARARRIARAYDAAFPQRPTSQLLAAASAADLRLLFRAAQDAALQSEHPQAISVMSAMLPTLRQRGALRGEDTASLYRSLLLARRFDQARALAAASPDAKLEQLPSMRDTAGGATTTPTAWRLSADAQTLVREPIRLTGLRLLVTAGCHFSEDAAADITADAQLAPVFARRATWLVAPPGLESVSAVAQWNRRFPGAQALMRYSDAEWAMLPSLAMPTFYIVRDGRIVERVTGWTRANGTSRKALVSALQRSGLLSRAHAAQAMPARGY